MFRNYPFVEFNWASNKKDFLTSSVCPEEIYLYAAFYWVLKVQAGIAQLKLCIWSKNK
jgi:hypothetical protein